MSEEKNPSTPEQSPVNSASQTPTGSQQEQWSQQAVIAELRRVLDANLPACDAGVLLYDANRANEAEIVITTSSYDQEFDLYVVAARGDCIALGECRWDGRRWICPRSS